MKNLYESAVLEITEGTKDMGILVQVQETKTTPVVVLAKMYTTEDGEYGFCSPRVSGAVQFRGKLGSKELGWVISELTKAKGLVEKAEKTVAKTATTEETKKASKKAEDAPVKRKSAKAEDLEIALESKRVNRKSVRI